MSLSENFFTEYAKIRETSKHCYVPDKATYDEIITYLSTGEMKEGSARKNTELINWKAR
jgi:hypothetical protein